MNYFDELFWVKYFGIKILCGDFYIMWVMFKIYDDDDGFMGECFLKLFCVSFKKEGVMIIIYLCILFLCNC